ncbi:DUF4318 domain-containing protein [Candidatus Clostridium stratigraminis]|uniref:DUF4318 domain-containing protein n=1 Tax=Candidatus Clostridium stratigraminis TaxID=3381661 RepID=A0ABW8T732_9CLOT
MDLEDALTHPSSQVVCKTIKKYFIHNKQEFDFVNTSTPVTIKLDGILYCVTVELARGGYSIYCKEI